MKQRISVRFDAAILRLAKQRAAEERRPLGELVQEALANYLRNLQRRPKNARRRISCFANDR